MSPEPGAFCPVNSPRFLCDEMLQHLGYWLRLAGYDTLLPPEGLADANVLALAIDEDRWLVTRDHGFLERTHAAHYLVLLEGEGGDAHFRELTRRMNIDWLKRPFSRCKNCNTLLEIRPQAACSIVLPSDVVSRGEQLSYCVSCEQYYWVGGHVHRMRQRLEALNEWREPSGSQSPSNTSRNASP